MENWQFEGVCFLLDETEFVVRQKWANNAWSYFRGLKDTDTALKPFLGFVLAGYRDLRDYQQEVGSALFNIAEVKWLTPLTEPETQALINYRTLEEGIPITEKGVATIIDWTGCHPYLTQQMLNIIFDDYIANRFSPLNNLVNDFLHQHHHDFSTWWNADNKTDGFGDAERSVYKAFIVSRIGTKDSLAPSLGMSLGATLDTLGVLEGTGVIRQTDKGRYAIGAKLFESWVSQQ